VVDYLEIRLGQVALLSVGQLPRVNINKKLQWRKEDEKKHAQFHKIYTCICNLANRLGNNNHRPSSE